MGGARRVFWLVRFLSKIERTHSGGTAPVLHRLASDSRMVLELTL
jgi:hypothetical protein